MRRQSIHVLIAVVAVVAGLTGRPALAQVTSTWSGGSGNWSDCFPGGDALWDTCPDPPKGLGWPNGNFNAVIQGGPVFATGAAIVNLSIASGDALFLTSGYVDVTGPSLSNNGSITISGGNGLGIGGAPTTLSGSGTVTLAAPGGVIRGPSGGGATVVIQQPIQGQGAIGIGTLGITNQSTVTASGGELDVQSSVDGFTNTGLIEASAGSKLVLVAGLPLNINNAGGTIKALDQSTILLQMGVSGGTISTVGSGNFTLAPPGAGAGLTSLTSAGTFNVPAGANLNWQGTIKNTGIFNLLGSISTNGSVTLQGSGTVLMNGGQFDGLGTNPLINQQLIHGGGTFYQMPLTNQATIQADNTSTALSIAGNSTTNSGTLEATGGGTLQLEAVINNSGGTIEAQDGSTVVFNNSRKYALYARVLKKRFRSVPEIPSTSASLPLVSSWTRTVSQGLSNRP